MTAWSSFVLTSKTKRLTGSSGSSPPLVGALATVAQPVSAIHAANASRWRQSVPALQAWWRVDVKLVRFYRFGMYRNGGDRLHLRARRRGAHASIQERRHRPSRGTTRCDHPQAAPRGGTVARRQPSLILCPAIRQPGTTVVRRRRRKR